MKKKYFDLTRWEKNSNHTFGQHGYTCTPNHDYFWSQDDEELRKVYQI